ncbi:U5 snRNP-specific protein-like factor and related proteins [Phaffia rhodozyma]|uniref:U5 snRNP-specific protein-like factor and related proteins n=1 Tax=Phaffia rhodozyma TaxID=264483 RepID=A0A0F7SEU5_PHARH|nr:U5 snRNP-specific protein-like factor and related proteins [Phaffia rhodozyma]
MIRKTHPPSGSSTALSKRSRVEDEEDEDPSNFTVAIGSTGSGKTDKGALIRTVKRTSGLEAPIVSLSGAHSEEILSCRFSPDGNMIAAASADKSVSLWKTYPPHTNTALLTTCHKSPILDVQFSYLHPVLYTCSTDSTVAITDLTTGVREKKYYAHDGVVNSIDIARTGGKELCVSGGDDGVVRVWDGEAEGKKPVIELGEDGPGIPTTAVCWSADGAQVFVGGIDNEIHVYDIRKKAILYSLQGHTDTIASLSLSPNAQQLLSSSFDSTLIVHDVKPFSPSPSRIHRVLHGTSAGFDNTLSKAAWSLDDGGRRVAVGGGDRCVTIWDVESSDILYKLPGHRGTVTATAFHPSEPIILTASKDATMLLGEIEPSA